MSVSEAEGQWFDPLGCAISCAVIFRHSVVSSPYLHLVCFADFLPRPAESARYSRACEMVTGMRIMWRVLQNCLLYVSAVHCRSGPGWWRAAPGSCKRLAKAPPIRSTWRSQPYSGAERCTNRNTLGAFTSQPGWKATSIWATQKAPTGCGLPYKPLGIIIRNWLLELGFRLDESARLYWTSMAGAPIQTGDMLTFDQRPYPHRHFIFPMLLDPGRSPAVYLQVESQAHSPCR